MVFVHFRCARARLWLVILDGKRPLGVAPFSEVAPKSKIARPLPTKPNRDLVSLAALRVGHVPILAASNEDVRGADRAVGAFR